MFSCELFEICKNTFFAGYHRTTASDYSSTSVVKGESANKTVNYGTKAKSICTNLSQKCSPGERRVKKGSPGERAGFRSSRSHTSN